MGEDEPAEKEEENDRDERRGVNVDDEHRLALLYYMKDGGRIKCVGEMPRNTVLYHRCG